MRVRVRNKSNSKSKSRSKNVLGISHHVLRARCLLADKREITVQGYND